MKKRRTIHLGSFIHSAYSQGLRTRDIIVLIEQGFPDTHDTLLDFKLVDKDAVKILRCLEVDDPDMVSSIRSLGKAGIPSATILRHIVGEIPRDYPIEVRLRCYFEEAFFLHEDDVNCVGGWWFDEGELSDNVINERIDPHIRHTCSIWANYLAEGDS